MVEIYTPHSLSKKRLDQRLSKGWFRSCNSLFRPQYVFLDNLLSDIVHIRLKLTDYSLGKRQLKRYNKIANRFTITTGSAHIDEDKEDLYASHKEKFKGFVFHSLEQVVFDLYPKAIFDTREVAIYDEDKLIGFSFFDIGHESMASIISIYDPSYEAYSLGIFSMMEEINIAQSLGMKYYYPGYIFDNNPAFDYKIRKENMQYLNPLTSRWGNFKRVNREDTVSHQIEQNINELHQLILEKNIDMNRRYYPLNSLGYLQFEKTMFVKGIYLLLAQISIEEFVVIEYLPEVNNYLISKASINNNYWALFELEGSSETYDPETCLDQLLEYNQIFFVTDDKLAARDYFIANFFI